MLSESVLLYSAVPDTAEPGRSDRHESGPDPAVQCALARSLLHRRQERVRTTARAPAGVTDCPALRLGTGLSKFNPSQNFQSPKCFLAAAKQGGWEEINGRSDLDSLISVRKGNPSPCCPAGTVLVARPVSQPPPRHCEQQTGPGSGSRGPGRIPPQHVHGSNHD